MFKLVRFQRALCPECSGTGQDITDSAVICHECLGDREVFRREAVMCLACQQFTVYVGRTFWSPVEVGDFDGPAGLPVHFCNSCRTEDTFD